MSCSTREMMLSRSRADHRRAARRYRQTPRSRPRDTRSPRPRGLPLAPVDTVRRRPVAGAFPCPGRRFPGPPRRSLRLLDGRVGGRGGPAAPAAQPGLMLAVSNTSSLRYLIAVGHAELLPRAFWRNPDSAGRSRRVVGYGGGCALARADLSACPKNKTGAGQPAWGWSAPERPTARRSKKWRRSRAVLASAAWGSSAGAAARRSSARFTIIARPVFLDSGQADGSSMISILQSTTAGTVRTSIPEPIGTLTNKIGRASCRERV